MSSLAPNNAPQLTAFPSFSSKPSSYQPSTHQSKASSSHSQPTSARATPSPLGSDSEDSDSSSAPNSPQSNNEDENEEKDQPTGEEEESFESTPLPSRSSLRAPKTIADRKLLVASGNNGGKKSMAAQLGRRRADSLKWAKYANMGPVVVELNLSQEELGRRD